MSKRVMLAVAGVAVMAFLATQCSTNPETGAGVQQNAPEAAVAQQNAPPEAGAPEHEVARIAVMDLKSKIESGDRFLLIDVREDWELEQNGAIAGAIHIPMGELDARMPDIPKDAEIVFY